MLKRPGWFFLERVRLTDIEQWSQSSGPNVIPRRARRGLAGLRPHSESGCGAGEGPIVSNNPAGRTSKAFDPRNNLQTHLTHTAGYEGVFGPFRATLPLPCLKESPFDRCCLQPLLADKDPRSKDTHRKMRCGR